MLGIKHWIAVIAGPCALLPIFFSLKLRKINDLKRLDFDRFVAPPRQDKKELEKDINGCKLLNKYPIKEPIDIIAACPLPQDKSKVIFYLLELKNNIFIKQEITSIKLLPNNQLALELLGNRTKVTQANFSLYWDYLSNLKLKDDCSIIYKPDHLLACLSSQSEIYIPFD